MKSPNVNSSDVSDQLLPLLDIQAVVADFRRFSRFFAAVFVLVFFGILVPVLMQPPQYTAVASVMMDPRTMTAGPDQDVLSGLPADTTTVDTEVEVLQSNALAERVVQSLKLESDPEFNPELRKTRFFGLIKVEERDEKLTPLAQQARHEAVVDRVLVGLSVQRQGLTRIISVSYQSLSAEKSQAIANEWARLYLSQQLETKFEATREANEWLSGRLEELKGQVEIAETAVQKYKIENNLLVASNDNTLGQQEISVYNQQLAAVKVDQAEANAKLSVARRQLASGSSGDDVGAALDSPVIKDLKAKRAGITQNLADLEGRYGPLHPEIVKAKRQLTDIDNQINAEINRIISNLEAEAQVQAQRAASLQGSVGRARGQLIGNNKAMVRLNELQRNADAVSTLYQSYLDRFKQTSSQQGLDRTDARIVSRASLPTGPSAPRIPLTAALAFACGLGVATGSVFVRRAFDSGLVTGHDVEAILNQPYLAGIASLGSTTGSPNKAAPIQYILEKPMSVFAEGFRSLRAALIYSHSGSEVKVIAVTSSLPGEGKTTTSICLARTMAMSGQSVVVVDCDLRRRSINKALGQEASAGLLEVLAGTSQLRDVLISDGKTSVRYLPLSESTFTSRDIFGSPAMDNLLSVLKTNFDIVILDTAPVLPVVDTRILTRKADMVAMLVHWRKTPRKAAQAALDILLDSGANVGGIALTQVNMREQAKYGYGDSGYYYKHYQKYYSS